MASCFDNCSSTRLDSYGSFEDFWRLADYFEYRPWLFSLLGSAMVGLSGVFPLLVIPIDEAADLKQGDSAKTLKILLSFAVGGLLGDVFLHLLPEAWANHAAANPGLVSKNGVNHASMGCGLWVLSGFLVFVIAEKLFNGYSEGANEEPSMSTESKKPVVQHYENNNCSELKNGLAKKPNGVVRNGECNGVKKPLNGVNYKNCNGYANGFVKANGVKPAPNGFPKINGIKPSLVNGFCAGIQESDNVYEKQICEKKPAEEERTRDRPKHISGYLNLVANCVDNFTHGLAVGGSFLISFRLGALTTFAILIHEIPHEIGDFAILLKSGFNRWDAAKAQMMTATGGICGAFAAVAFSGDAVESKTSWILPFTAGGFLHIGMVTVLPELLRETDRWESLKQMGALLTGIAVMAFLTIMCD